MIYITGDTHGMVDIQDLINFFEEESKKISLSKDDFVIICGDVSVCWDYGLQDKAVRQALSGLPVTVLFIDGNHENFDLLNSYDIEEWNGGNVHYIANDIMHLMRGQIFTIEDKKFFTFGGAHSVDKLWRREGVSWWAEEIPTKDEMEEGLINLKACDYSVDYIITHTAPYEVLAALGMDVIDEEEEFVRYLEMVRNNISFKEWYFGHLHMDEDDDLENYHALYNNVVPILL